MFYKIIRLGQWAKRFKIPLLAGAMTKLLRLLYSCDIPCYMDIPSDTQFMHQGLGVTINAGTVLGRRLIITQNVTLGMKNGKCPIIEDDVFIGTGAIILGGVTVGEGAKIGAGAVVLKDVPEKSTVAGNPAILLKSQHIKY